MAYPEVALFILFHIPGRFPESSNFVMKYPKALLVLFIGDQTVIGSLDQELRIRFQLFNGPAAGRVGDVNKPVAIYPESTAVVSAQQLPIYFSQVPYLPLRTGYQFKIKRTVTAFCGARPNAVKKALIGTEV